jgi:predicted aminopeptidase
MRERKQEVLVDIASAVRSIERQSGLRTGYDEWIEQGLNNAHLASIATYSGCVPGFQRLLADQSGDLHAFYAVVRKLERDAPGRRALCRQAALSPADAAAGAATAVPRP